MNKPDNGIKTLKCVHCGTSFRRDDARLQIYCSTPCLRRHTMTRFDKVKQIKCRYDDHIGVSTSRDMHDFVVMRANEFKLGMSEYFRRLIQKDYDSWLKNTATEEMKNGK